MAYRLHRFRLDVMFLLTWSIQTTDVMQLSFPQRGCSNKVIEISGVTTHLKSYKATTGARFLPRGSVFSSTTGPMSTSGTLLQRS